MRKRLVFTAWAVPAFLFVTLASVPGPSFAGTSAGVHRHVMVSANFHHDVSVALRDLKPSPGPSHAHPAKRLAGPSGPVVRAPDTSGQRGTPRIPSPSILRWERLGRGWRKGLDP